MKQSEKELITLKCPYCGAPLTAKKHQKFIKCEYCNHMFAIPAFKENVNISNAEQAGYEFEKGRQRAQREAASDKPHYEDNYSQNNLSQSSGYNHVNHKTASKKRNNTDQSSTIRITIAIILGLIITAIGCNSCVSDMTSDDSSTSKATNSINASIPVEGHYNITNATGEKIISLFIYQTGPSDKGINYAASGMDDGTSIKVDVKVNEKSAPSYLQTVEFTTESGDTENSFQTLSLEEADFSLVKVADLNSSATQQNVTFNKDVSSIKNNSTMSASSSSTTAAPQSNSTQSNNGGYRNESLKGRGYSTFGPGLCPDYTNVIGYVAVNNDDSIIKSDQFQNTDLWQVPTYDNDNGNWVQIGSIPHKTEVVVRDQKIHNPREREWFTEGYLLVERTDDHSQFWINVKNFVTSAYWDDSNLASASADGPYIAEYHNVSNQSPVNTQNLNATKVDIPDGTVVLVTNFCQTDTDGVNIQATVWGNWKFGYGDTIMYFNPKDLTIVY